MLSQNVTSGSASTGGVGGAVESEDGLLTISDCTIAGNQALGGTSAVGVGSGGGIEVNGGSATLSNSTFSDNSAVGAEWPDRPNSPEMPREAPSTPVPQ